MDSKKLEKILKQPWQFYISRNISIWHDELSLIYALYQRYGLRADLRRQIRIHRGVEADFYYLARGKFSREQFNQKLEARLADPTYLSFLKNRYQKDCEQLVSLARRIILTPKSLEQFFHFYGLATPMLDLTSISSKLITEKVLDLLRSYHERDKIIAYYSRPRKLAPIQSLEEELKDLAGKKVDLTKAASRLYRRYAWIPVSFVGEPWDQAYFRARIKNYQPIKSKPLIKPKTKISGKVKYYLGVLADLTYLNEYRKAAFSQANFYFRPILDQIAKEHELDSWKNLSLLTSQEILDLVRGRDGYQSDLIKKRSRPVALYNKSSRVVGFFYGNEVAKFERKFGIKAKKAAKIQGVVANRGRALGRVKIILGPVDFLKFNKGDILVAKMTSVDFIPIMKKAGAFVTDEGGLASRAAVVAREFGKPCLVGTGFATKVFKDNDMAEVDAERGIVKLIK